MSHRQRGLLEPKLRGQSVCLLLNCEDIEQLQSDAEQSWVPALVELIKVIVTEI